MSTRPNGDDMAFFLTDYNRFEPGRLKLSTWARRHRLGEARCPERHLLATAIRTPHGILVLSRATFTGLGWAGDWLDEIADPAAIEVWCRSCRAKTWTVDLSECAHPRVLPYHHGNETSRGARRRTRGR
jgi:hypothetical protein